MYTDTRIFGLVYGLPILACRNNCSTYILIYAGYIDILPIPKAYHIFSDKCTGYEVSIGSELKTLLLHTLPLSCIYLNPISIKMPTSDRSHGRNINFFNGQTGEHLGGVIQNGSISNENFFDMLMYTLLDVETQITIRSRATGQSLTSDSRPLELGGYDIFCPRGKTL